MTTVTAIFSHLALNVWLGWTILKFIRGNRNTGEWIIASFFIGFFAETLTVSILLYLGLSLGFSILSVYITTLILTVYIWKTKEITKPRFTKFSFKWYEWVLLLFIAEKIVFLSWQLIEVPVYYDDAMMHWAGRARSLFGGVNWFFDPSNEDAFLGFTGYKHYPLGIPIWRALTAQLNGDWNGIIARADCLLFYLSLPVTVWLATWRFSKIRWLASATSFIILTIPFQTWHAASGYADIAVEAYAVAALSALLRKEWLLAGILTAGTCWIKNDGLVLFLPALTVAMILLNFSWSELIRLNIFSKKKLREPMLYFLGLLTLFPWFIFKTVYSLRLSPGKESLVFHSDGLGYIWKYVFMGPTHSIYWIFIFVSILFSLHLMLKDQTGRALIAMLLISFSAVVFVFCFTDAFKWLKNQGTIHRSMLQLYGIAVIVPAYAVWLNLRPNPSGIEKVTRESRNKSKSKRKI